MTKPDIKQPVYLCAERGTEACNTVLNELNEEMYCLLAQDVAAGRERAVGLIATAEAIKARPASWGNTQVVKAVSQVFYHLADKAANPANGYQRLCNGRRTLFRQSCTAVVVPKPVRR